MKRLEPVKNALVEFRSTGANVLPADAHRLLAVRFFLLIDGVVQRFEEFAFFLRV
jgi:hypothetical protein